MNFGLKEGISLSTKVRDLIKEALEIEEDVALSEFAEIQN